MNTTLKFLIIIVLVSTFGSCTIEKRLFNNGYHIEWNRKFKRPESIRNTDTPEDGILASDENYEPDTHKEKMPIPADSVTQDVFVVQQPPQTSIDRVSHQTEQKQGNYTYKAHFQKHIHAGKLKKRMAYGGAGRGMSGLLFVVILLLIIGLVYLATSSANFAAMFLLLALAGWLLIALFIVLILVLLIRLFTGSR